MKIKQTTLIKSASIFSFMTFLSRILGFIRDIVIANLFGASYLLDAFFVAFKIPNFMRRLVAEGAFAQAFVPILSDYQKTKSQEETKQFIDNVAGVLASITSIIVILGIIFAPIIVYIFAPGFLHEENAQRYIYATSFLRVTFPYLFFITMTAFCGAILNSYGYYGAPAFAPIWLNVSMIGGALFLSGYFEIGIWGLVWGVFIAGILQFIFLLPFMYRKQLLPKLTFKFRDNGVFKILHAMIPALFGVSIAQLNLIMDTIFASFLVQGSVSWLYYADRLMNFPLGVMGVALSTVTLSKLSRSYAMRNDRVYSDIFHWATKITLLGAIPAMFGLVMLAKPIIVTLLFRGNFTEMDVLMTSKSLVMFGIGLPAFMLIKTLASSFYAQKNYTTPSKIGAVAILVNIVFNFILIKPLAHAGLALSTSIAAYVNMILLLVYLLRSEVYIKYNHWIRFFVKLVFATLMMVFWIYFWSPEYKIWINYSVIKQVYYLFGLIVSSMLIYICALFISGLRYSDIKGKIEI